MVESYSLMIPKIFAGLSMDEVGETTIKYNLQPGVSSQELAEFILKLENLLLQLKDVHEQMT